MKIAQTKAHFFNTLVTSLLSNLMRTLVAWFHDGEILRAESCLRNMDGCFFFTSAYFRFTPFLTSTHWRSEFFLAKPNLSLLQMHDSFRAKYFAEKKRSWRADKNIFWYTITRSTRDKVIIYGGGCTEEKCSSWKKFCWSNN